MLAKKMNKLNDSGFSLIELMVVVAIIGILAAIGIPQYSKFQAKTRQSEAKGALATIFTNETSFNGEWNRYTKDLRNMGFGVAGSRLRYITGFQAATGAAASCGVYDITGGAPGEFGVPNNTTQAVYAAAVAALAIGPVIARSVSCGTGVNVGTNPASFNTTTDWGAAGFVTCTPAAMPAMPSASTASACDAVAGTFTAIAVGDPNATPGAVALDGWTINQSKTLSNSTPGIQ